MTLFAAVVALIVVGAAVWYWRLPFEDELLEDRLRDEAVVTLKSGATFHGVLFQHDGKSLILRNAEALGEAPHPPRSPVDGEVLLRWDEVAYVQLP